LEKQIRIPRSLSVKAASVLKSFLNKVGMMWTLFCAFFPEEAERLVGGGSGAGMFQSRDM
jgi:hypothetical protein